MAGADSAGASATAAAISREPASDVAPSGHADATATSASTSDSAGALTDSGTGVAAVNSAAAATTSAVETGTGAGAASTAAVPEAEEAPQPKLLHRHRLMHQQGRRQETVLSFLTDPHATEGEAALFVMPVMLTLRWNLSGL